MVISERFYDKIKDYLLNTTGKESPDWFMEPLSKMYELTVSVEDIVDNVNDAPTTLELVTGLIHSPEVTRKFIDLLPGLYYGTVVNTTGDIYAKKDEFELIIFYDPKEHETSSDLILSIAYVRKFICFILNKCNEEKDTRRNKLGGKYEEMGFRTHTSYLISGMKDVNKLWDIKDQRYEITEDVMRFIRKDEIAMKSFKDINDGFLDISWNLNDNEDGEPISIFRIVTKTV